MEITWNVVSMDCYPDVEGKVDVVFNVHWAVNGSDGDIIASGAYGSVGLTLDPEAPFTPYQDLTKDQVLGWVKDALGEEAVAANEALVAQQIESQKNPPVVSPPLPWA